MLETSPDPSRVAECLARLVDATYDATVDPLRYEALLQCWEAFLLSRAAQARAADDDDLFGRFERGEDPQAAAVTAHFARAMEIFERLGRARRVEAALQAVVDALPAIGLVVDALGRVLARNAAAAALTPDPPTAQAMMRLDALAIEEDAATRLLEWIRGRAHGAAGEFLLAPCRIGAPARQSCLIATPLAAAQAAAAEPDTARGPCFLITTLDLSLEGDVLDAFVSAFALSAAEGAVAAALAQGEKPAEIAARRGASVNTVRSQIKSLTKKIGADGAADLVRVGLGFAASYGAARAAGRAAPGRLPPHALRRRGAATLPSGRRVGYVEQGAPNGRPALFLHSLCFGPYWPDRAIEAAARRRWRLICPWRPGFGDTDPIARRLDFDGALAAAVSDMTRLLDRLEIERAPLISHQTASIFAMRLALAAPNRVEGILSLGHLPIWRDAWIPILPSRLRLLARTTRYAPTLLPFFVRAATALIDAGEELRLGQAFFHDAEHELKAFRRPDVLAPMAEGVSGSARQGPFAVCLETRIALQNYAADLAAVRAPIRVLHGALDLTMPPMVFDGAEALAPNLETIPVADAGATLLYTHWPAVLDHLERLRAETAS